MKISRREFLILTAGLAAGCRSGAVLETGPHDVRIGRPDDYRTDGVYSRFRNRGVFIVRRGEKLFALSSICTHRNCKLTAESDRTFYCPCHGSTFDADGKVTLGPAKRDLPAFPITTDDQGELVVSVLGL